jgi:hypothetical protein
VTRLLHVHRVQWRHHTTISGLLRTPDGQPLTNTRILVLSRPDQAETRDAVVGIVTTSPRTGRFIYHTIARTSRIITLRYEGNTARQPAQVQLRLKVAGQSTIHVHPSHTSNGHTVSFHGRVRTPHIPPEGLYVQLQAWTPELGWRAAGGGLTRVGRDGRWRTRYTFHATVRTHRWPFRVAIVPQADYPYSSGRFAGHSRTIRVLVHG